MDPDATLADIQWFLANHETGDEVDDWCQNLFDWIRKGGFEPNWSKAPLAESYYRCREVSMRKAKILSLTSAREARNWLRPVRRLQTAARPERNAMKIHKVIALTDGIEVFEYRLNVDDSELTRLNEAAQSATDGNVWWTVWTGFVTRSKVR